jgi:hypothetical protein
VAGVTALAEALSHNEALQTLVLDTNSAGDEGAEVLARHLTGARMRPLLYRLFWHRLVASCRRHGCACACCCCLFWHGLVTA